AITIGVTNLRRRRNDDDTLRIKAIKNGENTLFERRTAYNRIIYRHYSILMIFHDPIRCIVYVLYHILPVRILRNERTQFCILDVQLFKPWVDTKHLVELFIRYFIGAIKKRILLQFANV